MPDDMARESPNLTRLQINTNSLIMEALRRLDEWSLIQDAVPSTKEVFIVSDASALSGAEEIPEVIRGDDGAIDGKTTVMGLAERWFMSEFECCQHLAALVKAGAIRALTQDELVERAVATLGAELTRVEPGHVELVLPFREDLVLAWDPVHHHFVDGSAQNGRISVVAEKGALHLVPLDLAVRDLVELPGANARRHCVLQDIEHRRHHLVCLAHQADLLGGFEADSHDRLTGALGLVG